MSNKPQKLNIPPSEVAKATNLTKMAVYNAIKNGELNIKNLSSVAYFIVHRTFHEHKRYGKPDLEKSQENGLTL